MKKKLKRKKNNHYYFVEQKIRDDHDSTKKRGQINNFEKKLEIIIDKFGDDNLSGYFYFIDPDLIKNKNFYEEELEKMSNDYGVELLNCYGKELFEKLGLNSIWEEIIIYLKKWRDELPDIPEINFDKEVEQSFNEIKDLSPSIFRKLFSNDELFEQIVKTIFPGNKVLKMLVNYFNNKNTKIYKTLTELIEDKMKKY